VLGHRDELARHRRPTGRPRLRGDVCSDRLQGDRVAAGGDPGQHPLHRHPPEQLGAVEHLVRGHRHLTGAVGGADPGPSHRDSPPAQGDRASLRAVPGRAPVRIVPAARPAHRGHVGLHQLLHHLQFGTDREGEQLLARVGCDLVHRDAHLLGHGERSRVELGRLVLLGHSGPLSSGCLGGRPTPTARKASGRGPPPQFLRDPGQPPVQLRTAPRGRDPPADLRPQQSGRTQSPASPSPPGGLIDRGHQPNRHVRCWQSTGHRTEATGPQLYTPSKATARRSLSWGTRLPPARHASQPNRKMRLRLLAATCLWAAAAFMREF
jgi:hypothetical protein